MFEILHSFLSRIISADAAYDEAIEKIDAAEKEALNRIRADEARIKDEYEKKMAAMKADHKAKMAALKASRQTYSRETEEAIQKHKELVARFEALLVEHGR